jgi:[ribosomal protein S5]-alanine N-acetyltransferase
MLPYRFETNRLILRPIAAEDAPAIFTGYARDPEVVRFLVWYAHHSIADSKAYIARCMGAPPDRECTYAVLGRADGAFWAPSPCGDPSLIGSIAGMCWRAPSGAAV